MSYNASETASYESIAANLDDTLLISQNSFPYFMLVAIEADSLILLSLTLVIIAYFFFSEALVIQILIFISFSGLKIHDKCKRKVVVTVNPTVIVEPFVKDFLGGDKYFSGGIWVRGIGVAW
ncbi:hypothetical protein CerSpe_024480 [Prunus speciosa]